MRQILAKILLFASIAESFFGLYQPNVAEAAFGGPDGGGYMWRDTAAGISYSWDDISSTGTILAGRSDDSMTGPIDMGFTFSFYGNNYSQIYVCNNGYVTFTNDGCSYTNGAVPNAGTPNNIIAPYWDDLYTLGEVRYETLGTSPSRRFVVSWLGVDQYAARGQGDMTFQAILYETNNRVKMQFMDTLVDNAGISYGAGATIGIEGAGGTAGTQFSQDTQTLSDGYALQFEIMPSLSQSGYRFFANTDSTDVGSALAAANSGATLSSPGDAFRLRILANVASAGITANDVTMRLQFAGKGAGTCASPAGIPAAYTDVTGATTIAYKDNATPVTGTTLTSNASDPIDGANVIINQTYVESNNFSNTAGAIQIGEDGKWDFALVDNGGEDGAVYCFRISTSYDVFAAYTYYPEITLSGGVASQTISFSLSANSAGFGTLSPSGSRYATSDSSGSDTEVSAHTITAATNAASGYVVTVTGDTLKKSGVGAPTISAIGFASATPQQGSEQFGIRVTASGGSGAATSPYDDLVNYAYAGVGASSEIASSAGQSTDTIYSVRYLANISDATEAGQYQTTLTYVMTAEF